MEWGKFTLCGKMEKTYIFTEKANMVGKIIPQNICILILKLENMLPYMAKGPVQM